MGFCQLSLRSNQGLIENDQSMDVYFHLQSRIPGKSPAAVEEKEMTLESSVDKWAPPVGTSGKDLAVAHC